MVRLMSRGDYMKTKSIAFYDLIVLLLPAGLSAQTTLGTILGSATDPSGAVIGGVTVVVRNTRTNIAQTVHTDSNGIYQVPNLVPGPYEVTGEQAGFKKTAVSGVLPETGATVRADLHF